MAYIEREQVRYVRLHNNGTLNISDTEWTSVEGIVPAPGDYVTLMESDGFYYATQIIERHRIHEPERQVSYWCLVYRDVEDSPHLERLTAEMMRVFPEALKNPIEPDHGS